MKLLILGGTGFLGSEIARQAVAGGAHVTCLARGRSGSPAPGTSFVMADRTTSGSYESVCREQWDAVIELSWQPRLVREALEQLSPSASHWLYVSSVSAYADHATADADESTVLLPASVHDDVEIGEYGSAKVACELRTREFRGDACVIARAGLIGGPGDVSDRSGYWVARAARDPHTPMLVPAPDGAASQVIDVRDLARWLLHCASRRVTGTFDAVGPSVEFEEWVAWSRMVGGHVGEVVRASAAWLDAHEVGQFMGAESMAMWVDESADMRGWSRRTGARALAEGLQHRDRIEMLRDLLEWERARDSAGVWRAGLSASREQELIAALKASE